MLKLKINTPLEKPSLFEKRWPRIWKNPQFHVENGGFHCRFVSLSTITFSRDRTRTCDLWVMSPTSCQLLYPATYLSTLKQMAIVVNKVSEITLTLQASSCVLVIWQFRLLKKWTPGRLFSSCSLWKWHFCSFHPELQAQEYRTTWQPR